MSWERWRHARGGRCGVGAAADVEVVNGVLCGGPGLPERAGDPQRAGAALQAQSVQQRTIQIERG